MPRLRAEARIHWQNLVNFGIIPLSLAAPTDYDKIGQDDLITLNQIYTTIAKNYNITVRVVGLSKDLGDNKNENHRWRNRLYWSSPRQSLARQRAQDHCDWPDRSQNPTMFCRSC